MAPANETDLGLCPEGLHALPQRAKEVGLDLRGAYLNLAGGVAAAHQRQGICPAGRLPNRPDNPRHRKRTKCRRQRFFNAAIHVLRRRGERTLAWEEKGTRLRRRVERLQQRP